MGAIRARRRRHHLLDIADSQHEHPVGVRCCPADQSIRRRSRGRCRHTPARSKPSTPSVRMLSRPLPQPSGRNHNASQSPESPRTCGGFLMHLGGQYSNPSAPLKVVLGLSDRRVLSGSAEPSYPPAGTERPTPPRLRWGAIQAAVIDVLIQASSPLRVRDVHTRVEGQLNMAVSYHSVCSFLTSAARSGSGGVERVGYGTYRAGQ